MPPDAVMALGWVTLRTLAAFVGAWPSRKRGSPYSANAPLPARTSGIAALGPDTGPVIMRWAAWKMAANWS